ncbi:MAG: hypothetical protein MJ188_08740 [Treponema sp.]|nr:hypothetical protein [Treponema sp.]
MKKDWINLERVVSFIGFLFLTVAFLGCYVMNGDPNSIIPNDRIVLLFIHSTCALASLVNTFFPKRITELSILIIESVFTIVTNYEMLGIFFFYNAIILILLDNLFKKRPKKLLILLFIIHFVDILLMFTHGWARTFIAFFTSFYFFAFYAWVYSLLRQKLSCLIPTQITNNSSLANTPKGSVVKLSDYNLSERQIAFILDYLKNCCNYKALSEKYNVSHSTVKHEFSEVFKVFNVERIEDLKILLLQYQIEK